jgi:AraC family transcriptional regulator
MSRGRAKLAIGEGFSVWLLEAQAGFGDAQFHSHHAIQLTACLAGNLSLATERCSIEGTGLAVAADALHKLEAQGLIAIVFVEPESAVGRTLNAKLFAEASLTQIDHPDFLREVGKLRSAFDGSNEDMMAITRRALDHLAPITCLRRPDERVQRVIDFAVAHLDRPLTLESASEGVYLSGSRLRHLFVEQTGLAFRTYLLWLRLVRAVQLYSEGQSLTEAAHQAGFADSAHFSRVFKRTFGLPATTLSRV